MEKSDIKYLKNYLDTSLKIQYPTMSCNSGFQISNLTGLTDEDGIETTHDRKINNSKGDYLSWKSNGNHDCDALHIKAILRPYSDITKPLPDGTIPIVELAKMANCTLKLKGEWEVETEMCIYGAINSDHIFWLNGEGVFCYAIVTETKERKLFVTNQLELFQYLFDNHFDVFNWIGTDKAIDVNTLKKKIYK